MHSDRTDTALEKFLDCVETTYERSLSSVGIDSPKKITSGLCYGWKKNTQQESEIVLFCELTTLLCRDSNRHIGHSGTTKSLYETPSKSTYNSEHGRVSRYHEGNTRAIADITIRICSGLVTRPLEFLCVFLPNRIGCWYPFLKLIPVYQMTMFTSDFLHHKQKCMLVYNQQPKH